MKRVCLFLLFCAGIVCSQTTDWNSLIGKRVVTQRMLLYVPGTFQQISLDYAGKQATIIAVKPYAMPQMRPDVLARMSPQALQVYVRELMRAP